MRYVALLLLFSISAEVFPGSRAQVFVLHSYSQEYPWTRDQHEGFIQTLMSGLSQPPVISTEYLDTKRRQFDQAYAEKFSAYLEYKYANYRPDLVYVTDDNALRFALSSLEEIFPGVPVIFSGVNDYAVQKDITPSRVTGVFEKKEISANIELLESMARDVKDIVVVGDASGTYLAIEQDIKEALQYHPKINATYIAEKNIDQLVALLQQRREQYLFLTTLGEMSDASGQTLALAETIRQIAAAGDFIILSMEDAYLFPGVLGGFVTSGKQQGNTAGSMALSCLSGDDLDRIEAVEKSPNEYIFDQAELSRHGLKLPQDVADVATILNQPTTFYERNRSLVLGTMVGLLALIFLLMAGFLILLSIKNRQIQKKKNKISEQADALRKAKNSLTTAQQVAHLGSWERDISTNAVTWSDEVFRIFGEQPRSFRPTLEIYLSYLTPEDHAKTEAVIADAIENKNTFEVELKITRKDGSVRYVREMGYVNFSESGKPTNIVGTVLDITNIKNAEQQEKQRFEQVERFQDALLEWSRVDYKNIEEALQRATEISSRTLNVDRVSIWLYNDDRSAIKCEILYLASSGEYASGMELSKREFPRYFEALQEGKLMAITDAMNDVRTSEFTQTYLEPLGIVSMLDAPIFYHGNVIGVVCHEQVGVQRGWSPQDREFSSAISKTVSLSLEVEKRKGIEEQLEHQAYHDELTNLPNRSLFLDRLDQAIKQAHRANNKLAVLFLDLDNFKEINDSLGHATGDQVLVYIANKLRDNLREVDTIARLGGDEFTLIINSIEDVQPINNLVEHLVDVLQDSMVIGDNELYITSSIGISVYPDDGETSHDLLRNADAAMYKAKDEGRNSYQFYTQDMTERAFQRVLMEANLRRALENEEFVVYYQPQYDVEQHALVGVEALLRWEHPEMGMVSPAQFIPMAEETGLIVPIDRWVMRTAMAQVSEWYREGLEPGKLALNLAVKQLYQADLLEMIGLTLRDTGFRPQWLALEITEGEIMKKPDRAIDLLQRISDLGIEIAIDDFGTGYSSLSYLKRLPVDKLKIDQSFVRDIPGDEEDEAIVLAVIALARSMGLDIIAEGVETEQQQAFLLQKGCAQIQGYLHGRPMTAEVMRTLLNGKSEAANA